MPSNGKSMDEKNEIPHLIRWIGPAIIIVIGGLIMLIWSWRTWPDARVDFGMQLYLPWQIIEGKVLYRDLAYFNGPLSVYWNALVFKLLGISIRSLVISNLFILTLLLLMLYQLFRRIGNRWSATGICLVFLLLFAFAQFTVIGNYNFVTPYTHESTHGLVLGVAAVVCLSQYQRQRKTGWIAAAGLAMGLAFLTKAEVFIGPAAATLVGLALILWSENIGRRRVAGLWGIFLLTALLPAVIAIGLLSLAMPISQALRGAAGSWVMALDSRITSLDFYREGMGTLDPLQSLRAILIWSTGYILIFAPAVALGLLLRRPGRYRTIAAWGVFLLVAGLLQWRSPSIDWSQMAKPLTLVILALAAATAIQLWRGWNDSRQRQDMISRLILYLLAFGLLSKIILNARIWQYGFVLAMPATLLFIEALIHWGPAWIDRRGGCGGILRAAGLAVLVIVLIAHLRLFHRLISQKIYRVGEGADAFMADRRGLEANAAIEAIRGHLSPGQTLLVLPHGPMLNYLSRRSSSIPYINNLPPDIFAFGGEQRIIDALNRHPPDYILLVMNETSAKGFIFMGKPFGGSVLNWVREHYEFVKEIRSSPASGLAFLMLRRNSSI